MTYSHQNQSIRSIITKYWQLLTDDPVLSSQVSERPSITYRRVRSLKDTLVHSHYSEGLSTPQTIQGNFPCGGCDACGSLDTHQEVVLPDCVKWHQRHHLTCATMGVIYVLHQCTCKSYYVGKTSRVFNIRMVEHISEAQVGYFHTIIGSHIALSHEYKFEGLKFLPLAIIPPHDRGGYWDQALLRSEYKWIFKLKADQPPGLNDLISFSPFL